MNYSNVHKTFIALLAGTLVLTVSCTKSYEVVSPILPLEEYTYRIFDSVEGNTNTFHYQIDRIIKFQYDPNVDKCYMPQPANVGTDIDTFDRSHFWKRGYINRRDLHHRIIFNGDTITIHHAVPNTVGEKGFRYTSGVKL